MHIRSLAMPRAARALCPGRWYAVVLAVATLAAATPSAAEFTCSASPMNGCLESTPPHPTGLWMNVRGPQRSNVVWKWFHGASETVATFADPTTTSDYAFCLYRQDAGQALLFAATAPAASQCKGRACWRRTGTGYRYRTGTGLPDGVTKIYLDARTEGRSRIVLKGRGEHLHLPGLPVPLPLRVQLQANTGQCWEGQYANGTVSQNSARRFRGRAVQP